MSTTFPAAGRARGGREISLGATMPSVHDPAVRREGLDELMPFTDDSLLRMQRNVFERLRPLESMPAAAAAVKDGGKPSGGHPHSTPGDPRTYNSGTVAAPPVAAAATALDPGRNAKPAVSFACLIGMAILQSPRKRLTVSEVYAWMKRAYPYFGSAQAGTGWKNSVRHNLSLNKHFVKQERPESEAGSKGSHWCIRPASLPIMEAAIRKQHPGALAAAAVPAGPQPVPPAASVRRPAAARRARPSAARSAYIESQRLATSPSTQTAHEAASVLFKIAGAADAHGSATAAAAAAAAASTFPSLAVPAPPGRAWSATVRMPAGKGFPTPPSSSRPPSSVIKATYNPNAYKQTSGFARPAPPRHGARRGSADEGSMDTAAEQQQQQAPQKLFTFTAPMSFSTGAPAAEPTPSRYTPETTSMVSFSPTSIRRRLAPLDGMDCDEDPTTNTAVSALLGLGGGR